MGTYDTPGGSPRHDPATDLEPVIVPEENAALAILEGAGVDRHVNDQIVRIIGHAAGRIAELERALLDLHELLHDAIEHECETAGL